MVIRMILSSFVAIFMFLIASAVAFPPYLTPISGGNLCDFKECGKGTCKATPNQMIPYICECEAGWKQFIMDDSFRDLPCVIPNCTMNYSCMNAPTPAAAPSPANHHSILDPCRLVYCGQGTCMKTLLGGVLTVGHHCECADGSANLLNRAIFPCFNECALGVNCVNLGLGFPNRSSQSGGVKKACSDLSGNLLWLIISAISLAMVA